MKKLMIIGILFAGISAMANSPLWLRYTAISPDGNTILFTYNADIYKVSSQGGIAVPLTLFDGRDFMPVWSPDGSKIAFASDRYGNYDIFVMNADGSNLKRLTRHSASDYPCSFTPDGKNIVFTSYRQGAAKSVYFPSGVLSQVYQVSVDGGQEKLLVASPMEGIAIHKDGKKWLYHDKKGYEDPFRKRHKSSVTRDIWLYDGVAKTHKKITDFAGEDRHPFWIGSNEFVYLSEKSGSYNVHKRDINSGSDEQITSFSKHPVRNLSRSNDGTLCFNFDGEVYTMKQGTTPQKVKVEIQTGERYAEVNAKMKKSGATELALSPDGKEIAFVIRGEVFVASLQSGITKRITNTPEQERNVSFSPDGKSLLYAAEKNNIWGVYRTVRVKDDESHFFNATVLREEHLVVNDKESFQPAYSPDGKEVAYLENRTALKVYNLETKKIREIMPASRNYSYSDGDQWFQWSPDGKYLLMTFLEPRSWTGQVGMIEASGNGKLVNLTESGYGASNPTWMMNGKMIIWFSGRNGMKNHASWGFQGDVYGMFLTAEAFSRFNLNEMEYELLKESEKVGKKDDKTEDKKVLPVVKIDLNGLKDRKKRLTIHSSSLGGAVVTDNGESIYYLSKFEKGYDIWVHHFYKNETKLFLKLDAGGAGGLELDKENQHLLLIADGTPIKVALGDAKRTNISFNADFEYNAQAERAYIFQHAWRQVVNKFYLSDLHGIDWEFYKKEYQKFLPHINNNYDFAEMLSELLGELDASHTGCRFWAKHETPDETASLGVFFDHEFYGKGQRIARIIEGSPLHLNNTKVKEGTILLEINGVAIDDINTYESLMNRQAGKVTLFKFSDKGTTWEERIKPIKPGELNHLLYHQWVRDREADVERLSKGRLGYVHVQNMNDESFRMVYEKALGKHGNKEALIVDTRFNGGGWLHDDLATFLSGEKYFTLMPRGQDLGDEPMFKWRRPSVVLMGEGNYSDAHMFPEVYKALKIGKLIGMPVPGTATAVWWETQIDPSMVFGIPQVGVRNTEGKFLENKQLEPDIKVANSPEKATNGVDEQLEAAVRELLGQLDKK